MNWEGLDVSILGPACVAGLIVLSTHVPLGKQVLSRGIIFIDLAIAQIAGLGVILAQFIGVGEHGYMVQVAAAAAALLGAGLLAWTDRRWPEYQEPLIGTLFALAATGGLLLLANNPQGGEHLKDLLVGQILWVSYAQLLPALILSIVLLAFMWLRRGQLAGLAFYALFALAITASVQLVGVYLVFASLIVPALATAGMQGRGRLVTAYAIGAAGYVTGLVLSAVLDLPSGALIVWMLAACALLAQAIPAVRRSHPARAVAAGAAHSSGLHE
ncbi:metal ABC transporter permease [Lysobacter lacus]|uniref:Metal ABC transporter permease n=1 Tax=Cognatilysobacter lacus TaxID=1643323 RepID=A0A5D8Z8H0_9GAMM|nr:metal ABC transporter permease [Lysobacter lacus]